MLWKVNFIFSFSQILSCLEAILKNSVSVLYIFCSLPLFVWFFYSSLFLKHHYGVGYTLTLVKVCSLSDHFFSFLQTLMFCNWKTSVVFILYFFLSLCFQSAPTASIAGDIVYRHVPSATCVSEVLFSQYSSFKIYVNFKIIQHVFICQW